MSTSWVSGRVPGAQARWNAAKDAPSRAQDGVLGMCCGVSSSASTSPSPLSTRVLPRLLGAAHATRLSARGKVIGRAQGRRGRPPLRHAPAHGAAACRLGAGRRWQSTRRASVRDPPQLRLQLLLLQPHLRVLKSATRLGKPPKPPPAPRRPRARRTRGSRLSWSRDGLAEGSRCSIEASTCARHAHGVARAPNGLRAAGLAGRAHRAELR